MNSTKQSTAKSNGHALAVIDGKAYVQASAEAEKAVLGSILLKNEAFAQAASILEPEDFSLDSHRRIYRRMVELAESGCPIDFVTLTEQLAKHKETEAVGGEVYVMSLTDGLPRTANISHHARIVKDKSILRRIQTIASGLAEDALSPAAEPEAILREAISAMSVLDKAVHRPPIPWNHLDAFDAVLNNVYAFIRRFVSLTHPQAVAITLTAAHSHAIDAADCTGYLSITSAEKRSGKTRLLEVLELLVARPWLTAHATAAIVARKIGTEHRTLLLDETDTAFKGGEDSSETMRATINSGYRRSGSYDVMGGKDNRDKQSFCTFGVKIIAGIGKLPDTIADRSIPIRLKRKSASEPISRFRRRLVIEEAKALHDQMDSWAAAHVDTLSTAFPALPDELNDRAQECVEPLLAIADLAGGEWADEARSALVELYTGDAGEEQSLKTELLADIRVVFRSKDVEALASEELVTALNEMPDHPWCEINHDKPLTQRTLARFLKPFGIAPHRVWIGERQVRGYEKADFEGDWARYLPLEVSQASPANVYAPPTQILEVSQDASVTHRKSEKSPVFMHVVTHVTDKKPETGGAEPTLDTSGDFASQEIPVPETWNTTTPDDYEVEERAALMELVTETLGRHD